ncbi:MAG: beta-1,6-N-acetylglucosaminyltransferase [Bacteroidia bacterium]
MAILILAHQYPGQVSRLIKSLLTDDDVTIFIHVDSRSVETFNALKKEFSSEKRVVLIKKRYRVYWGSYNQVLATLELLHAAKESGPFDYYNLISGQDLPIKPIEDLKKFLIANNGKEFLAWYKLPHHENHGKWGGMDRMELFWLDEKSPFKYLYQKTNDLVHKFQRRTKLSRKINFDLYAGANWFTLSNPAIDYVFDFLRNHRFYLRAFKYTRCADEIFMQSILLNSPFRENIVNDCLRYVDWKSGPEYPKVLRNEDLNSLLNSENKFFGRKFDERIDQQIIEKLTARAKA